MAIACTLKKFLRRTPLGPAFLAGILFLGAVACRTRSLSTSAPSAVPSTKIPRIVVTMTDGRLVTEASPSRTPQRTPTVRSESLSTLTLASSPTSSPTREPTSEGAGASQRTAATSTPISPTTGSPSPTPIPMPLAVSTARVVYHDGFMVDDIGIYEVGASPWLDLLVQMDGSWYGPERRSDDEILAQPLPEGYRWEAVGSFGTLSNGEAWWLGSGTEGEARLIGPGNGVVVELPLRIGFRSGRGEQGPEATSEPLPTCPAADPTPT